MQGFGIRNLEFRIRYSDWNNGSRKRIPNSWLSPGTELRPVERLEESETASLARDRGQRILRAGGTCRGILSRICHTRAGTSVRIAHKHAAGFVHSNVVEIQQIATRVVASLVPDATALNRIGRRRID